MTFFFNTTFGVLGHFLGNFTVFMVTMELIGKHIITLHSLTVLDIGRENVYSWF